MTLCRLAAARAAHQAILEPNVDCTFGTVLDLSVSMITYSFGPLLDADSS